MQVRSERLRRAIEEGMHKTAHQGCVGRDGTGKTKRAKVVKVERVENLALWKAYCHRKCARSHRPRGSLLRVAGAILPRGRDAGAPVEVGTPPRATATRTGAR